MKKISLLFVTGIILCLNLSARKIEGRIIFEHDTLNVVFNIPTMLFSKEPNYEKLQSKVVYYDLAGKKIKLRPYGAIEIQFTHESEDVRMLSRPNSLSLGGMFSLNKFIFLKLEIDGELKLFKHFFTQHSPGTYNASAGTTMGGYSYNVEKYILQKGDGALKQPKSLTFKKDMLEYLNDCPALQEMIENKDFRRNDLESIVRFYNSRCI